MSGQSGSVWSDLELFGDIPEEIIGRIEEEQRWTVPPEEELASIEDLLAEESVDIEERLDEELQMAHMNPPGSYRPPSTDGKSACFAESVEAFKWAAAKARWPKITESDNLSMDISLTSFAEKLTKVGDIEVMKIEGDPSSIMKQPLLLVTWLACLNMGHVAEPEEVSSGVRLMVRR